MITGGRKLLLVIDLKYWKSDMRVLLTLFCCFSMVSCSSIDKAKMQSILVETPYADGAKCRVTDNKGNKGLVNKTPSTVTVREGHPPLVVICEKKGYKNTHVMIDAEDTKVRQTNELIEEIAGMIEDPYAAYATQYPDTITVWMEPDKWESEDVMRQWAFDKKLYEDKQFERQKEKREAEERHIKELELEIKLRQEQERQDGSGDKNDKEIVPGIN